MSIKINGKTVAGMGIPGLSPYQVAKAGGYTGTEEDFNRALADLPDAVESAQQIEIHNTDGEAHADIRQAIAQPDWNQNNSTAPDYIKNRTHGIAIEEQPVACPDFVLVDKTLTFEDGYIGGLWGNLGYEGEFGFGEVGRAYTVTWDGTTYECECYLQPDESGSEWPAIGGFDKGYPFLITYIDNWLNQVYAYDSNGVQETGTTTHTISVYETVEIVYKLDPKYLPKFIVTFTYDGDGGYTCDKTSAEIKAAWDSGSSVVGVNSDNGNIYTLKWVTDSEATFVYFFEGYWQGLTIYEDGSVDMYEFHPLDNQGDYMYGPLTLYSDPTSEMQAATKQYVDAKVFTATYGTTTFAEIKAAYDGGATVLCTRADNSVKYVLTGLTSTTAYFMGMGSSTNILYRVYVDTEWHAASFTPVSSTQMNTAIETAIGTAIGGSY